MSGPQTEVQTARLCLRPAAVAELQAAAAKSIGLLGDLLSAEVAADWPPDLMQDAFAPIADMLATGQAEAPWSMYWIVTRAPRVAIGTVGFKAAPQNGRVDIGYTVVASHQRRGYASEAVAALIEIAFNDARVERVVGETLPDLIPSMGVMEKVGMRRVADAATGFSGEEDVVRYEITREAFIERPTSTG